MTTRDLFGQPAKKYGDASFSHDGVYRYTLSRRQAGGHRMIWIMLNPSTADAAKKRPTIRQCIGFARREGFISSGTAHIYGVGDQ